MVSPVSIFSNNHAAIWSSKAKPGPAVERVVARPARRTAVPDARGRFFLAAFLTGCLVFPHKLQAYFACVAHEQLEGESSMKVISNVMMPGKWY